KRLHRQTSENHLYQRCWAHHHVDILLCSRRQWMRQKSRMIKKVHCCSVETLPGRMGGLTLIEVLVTMLVLSIGLLGLAGLQALMLYQHHSAYQRSQATILTYDIIDRMRTNRNAALNGDYDLNLTADTTT